MAGTTDTVPAMLTPGEFVIKQESAAMLGEPLLRKLNAVSDNAPQGYQVGGGVNQNIGVHSNIDALIAQSQLANMKPMSGGILSMPFSLLANILNKPVPRTSTVLSPEEQILMELESGTRFPKTDVPSPEEEILNELISSMGQNEKDRPISSPFKGYENGGGVDYVKDLALIAKEKREENPLFGLNMFTGVDPFDIYSVFAEKKRQEDLPMIDMESVLENIKALKEHHDRGGAYDTDTGTLLRGYRQGGGVGEANDPLGIGARQRDPSVYEESVISGAGGGSDIDKMAQNQVAQDMDAAMRLMEEIKLQGIYNEPGESGYWDWKGEVPQEKAEEYKRIFSILRDSENQKALNTMLMESGRMGGQLNKRQQGLFFKPK